MFRGGNYGYKAALAPSDFPGIPSAWAVVSIFDILPYGAGSDRFRKVSRFIRGKEGF